MELANFLYVFITIMIIRAIFAIIVSLLAAGYQTYFERKDCERS